MHWPPAEHMQMQMIHRLPAFFPSVDHDAKSLREVLLRRRICGAQQEMAEQFLVFRAHLRERSDVLARNHQQMHRRLWMNIGKSDARFILIQLLRRNLTVDDFAK